MSGSAKARGSAEPEVDVAIVGGGIIGFSIADAVARRWPEATIAVVDRDAVGSGASRRSAGLHFPRGASARVRQMAAFSQAHYERLMAAAPNLPVYPVPMTVVARAASDAEVEDVYLPEAKLSRAGGPLHPAVHLPPETSAWTVEGGQYANVHALANWLAVGLRDRVRTCEAVRVTHVDIEPRHVVLRLGNERTLTARRVVLAPGPWTGDPAWRDLLAPFGIRVKRVVALHIEQRPRAGDPAVVFHDEDAFLLPLHYRGHWLYSYTCRHWDVDPDQSAVGLSAAELVEAREPLDRYAPDLADQCVSGRIFCDAFSPDRAPVVEAVDRAGRLVFAGAANGSGYRLAPAIAAEAADLLAAGDNPGRTA